MSSDPYQKIPNLTGYEATRLEDTRGADPSRFFASPGRGVVDAVTGRILNVPHAAAYRLATHNIPTGGASTPVQMDTIDGDPDHMIDLSSATLASRFTCHTPGIYVFAASILWPAPASVTFRQMNILKNGAIWDNTIQYPNTAGAHSQHLEGQIKLLTGDYVEIGAAQNTGGTIALLGNTFSPRDISMQLYLASTFGSDQQ